MPALLVVVDEADAEHEGHIGQVEVVEASVGPSAHDVGEGAKHDDSKIEGNFVKEFHETFSFSIVFGVLHSLVETIEQDLFLFNETFFLVCLKFQAKSAQPLRRVNNNFE